MKDYFEVLETMTKMPKVKIGSIINCQGITSEIKELYYSDRYVTLKDDEYQIFYDVEFKDTNGIYRHWKSYFDGGKIVEF